MNNQIVDVLAIGAHPDDIELSCAGTLLKLKEQGYKIGMVDMTRGERGSRGTAEIRAKEAQAALDFLGFEFRENLDVGDQHVRDTPENRVKVVECIRRHKPKIVFTHWLQDRHPDHEGTGTLVKHAMFLSGAANFEAKGETHVPARVLFWPSYSYVEPTIYVDISSVYAKKITAAQFHKSQFYDPNVTGPETHISNPQFWDTIEARYRFFGAQIGVKYAEGFFMREKIRVDNIIEFSAGKK